MSVPAPSLTASVAVFAPPRAVGEAASSLPPEVCHVPANAALSPESVSVPEPVLVTVVARFPETAPLTVVVAADAVPTVIPPASASGMASVCVPSVLLTPPTATESCAPCSR